MGLWQPRSRNLFSQADGSAIEAASVVAIKNGRASSCAVSGVVLYKGFRASGAVRWGDDRKA